MGDSVTVIPPRRRASRLKKLGLFGAGLLALLVVLYLIATSAAFFNGVILPRVGKAVGADITVAGASISPFSRVVLSGIKVQTTGSEPLLTAQELRARYSLMDILRGHIKVDEITVNSPTIQIVQNADGSSNLDPFTRGAKAEPVKATPAQVKPAKPLLFDLKKFALNNATIRRVKNLKDGGREITELSNLSITAADLGNERSGKFTLSAEIKIVQATNDLLQGKVAGALALALDANLHPKTAVGNGRLEVVQAQGAFKDLAALAGTLDCELTPAEVKQLALRFSQAGNNLGTVTVSGPLDSAKLEGELQVEVSSIDRRVLNLAGAAAGIDFGNTAIQSSSRIELAQGGNRIRVNGQLLGRAVSLASRGQQTPPLDLQLAYDFTADRTGQSALLQSFALAGTQNGRELLRGALAKPMKLDWGKASGAADESAFDLTMTGLDLADWQVFLGDVVSQGKLSTTLKVLSQRSGKQLGLDLNGRIDDLTAKSGGSALTRASATLKARGEIDDFKKVNLSDFRLALTHQGQPVFSISGSAKYDTDSGEVALQSTVEMVLERLLGRGTATPLMVETKLDGAMHARAFDLRQWKLAFSPTQRAPKNELLMTGQFDFSARNAMKGSLRIKAEALDATQLYDAFAGQKKPPPAAAPAKTAAVSAPVRPNVEPAAVQLPFQQFSVDLNVGRLYLREIAVTNWLATVKIDGGRVVLKPFELTLNGAPIAATAELNLGVTGYQYDVALVGDRVPVAPVADAFSSDYRGQAKGDLLVELQIKGAGITGASLQKSLSGHVGLVLTNADIQLVGQRAKQFITPIAVLLRLSELKDSPVTRLVAQAQAGDGKIALKQFQAASSAFFADTRGEISIAPVLADSPLPLLPVHFYLSRPLAQKLNWAPTNVPPEAAYVPLPDFVTLAGTIGKLEVRTDKVVIGGLLLRSTAGIPGVVGGTAGNILQGVGNLLTGQRPPAAGVNTNPTATKPPKGGLLDLFKKK